MVEMSQREEREVQVRGDINLDALERSSRDATARHLIQSVRDTINDPYIVSRIMDNESFQAFARAFAPPPPEQFIPPPPPEQSLPPPEFLPPPERNNNYLRPRRDNQDDFTYETSSDSNSNGRPSSPYEYYIRPVPYSVTSDDEDDEGESFYSNARRAARERREIENSFDDRAFHRLDAVCRHITPQLGLFSSPAAHVAGRRYMSTSTDPITTTTTSSFVAEEVAEEAHFATSPPVVESVVENHAQNEAIPDRGPNAPNMEGAGVPPQEEPSSFLYTALITVCIVPLVILTIITAKTPSKSAWKWLANSFNGICKKVL